MTRKAAVAAAALGTFIVQGCSSATTPASSTSTVTTLVTTTTDSSTGQVLPISVSNQLTSSGQDPSILRPSSCRLQGGVLTAKGTAAAPLPEVYIRFGDVVELYAYSRDENPPDSSNEVQVLHLGSETPGRLVGGAATWSASAPVANGFPPPLHCFVAVQTTHAFMGAGNAGG